LGAADFTFVGEFVGSAAIALAGLLAFTAFVFAGISCLSPKRRDHTQTRVRGPIMSIRIDASAHGSGIEQLCIDCARHGILNRAKFPFLSPQAAPYSQIIRKRMTESE
jgi:hypothetical protein